MQNNLIKILFFSIILFAVTANIDAQSNTLTQIDFDSVDKVYIINSSLEAVNENDIRVRTETSHHVPLTIESVDDKIYKTRTHYLLNKKLNKYGLLEVSYYDEDGKELKTFKYGNTSEIENYKYNFPIIPGSETEAILNKCTELLAGK